MRGIKECVNWLLDNIDKKIENDNCEVYFDGNKFYFVDMFGEVGDLHAFKMFQGVEWKPVKEPVDFITAINSGKKIEPAEYLDCCNESELKAKYEHEDNYYMRDAIWSWLSDCVEMDNQLKYINGMWIVKE